MKNILKKNSRKVNVSSSNCGALDCYEKQTEKEVEIYKPIAEDTTECAKNSGSEVETCNKESCTTLSASITSSTENVGDTNTTDSASTETKMVQEDASAPNDGADEQMLGAEDNEKLAEKREEVKFIKGDHQNGDAKIDIGAVNGKAFTGMTKEELMKYANDPFWVRLRWIFFIAFWLIWLGMLVGAVIIIIGAPKCAAPEQLPWYKRGVLAKFSGFEATKENVDVVKQIGADGVIYELPAELTYNVHDPAVEEKIKNIVSHYKDNHVILDVTANYVGKTSRLMQEAMEDEGKRSAFVWLESSTPPNNWVSLVNGSAWAEVSPGNYVLSQFGDGLFDLHMNDTLVKKELDAVLKHLIVLGVKGIRLKNTKFFILSKQIKDEEPKLESKYDLTQYGFWTHTQTTFQEGLGDVLYQYVAVVKNASAEAFLSVADDVIRPVVYRTSSGEMGIDVPMYGKFVKSLGSPKDKQLRTDLINVMQEVGNHTWMQWNVADVSDDSQVNLSSVTLFLSLLPGTPVVDAGKLESNQTSCMFKKINEYRASLPYMYGDFAMLPTDPLVSYTRTKSHSPGFLVVFNPTEVNQKLNITSYNLPEAMTLKAVSDNFNATDVSANCKKGVEHVHDLIMPPYSTIILTYVNEN